MNTLETQHSPNKQGPTIKFGPHDDSAIRVENVLIFLHRNEEVWDVRKGQDETKYDIITVIKDCTEIRMNFFIKNQLKDMVFIPLHNVKRVHIQYFLKEKIKK